MRVGKYIMASARQKQRFFIGRHYYLTESKEWRAALLGQWGFSYKYIASKISKCKLENVEKWMLYNVGKALKTYGVKVRDYRNGENFGRIVMKGLK